MARILVVDDEVKIRELVRYALEREGHAVFEAVDGVEALQVFGKESPDMVVLDIMMPVVNGWQVLEGLRMRSQVPVIMLSGKTTEEDTLKAFQLKADDYVRKPFSSKELAARVEAVLRRVRQKPTRADFDDGHLLVDLARQRVTVEGEEVRLPPIERALLRELVSCHGELVSYDRLIEAAWGEGHSDDTSLLHDHTSLLRKAIEPGPDGAAYIFNVRGTGYRFGENSFQPTADSI